MRIMIDAASLNPYDPFSNVKIEIELPNQCPRCGTALSAQPSSTLYFESDNFSILYTVFFCPHCEECFFAEYDIIENFSGKFGASFTLYPAPESNTNFSDAIKLLSPKFIETYHQSEKAENTGLTEICGVGYRKSLEYLIKDYAKKSHPNNFEEICKKQLSACINEYIDNDKIKALAKASAWIGNDETHYVRKHEDYNLQHLKAFIAAIVSYIDSEFSYLEAKALLTTSKK